MASTKLSNIFLMLLMNLWPETVLHFKPIEIIFLPYYPKEPLIFPYIRQYHSTPSLPNNPDTDSHQDLSTSSQSEREILFASFITPPLKLSHNLN